MNASPLQAELSGYGYRLELNGDNLKLIGTGPRPPKELLKRLKAHKGVLIAERTRDKQPAPVCETAPCPVDFAERAAIREFDGEETRTEAERAAAREYRYDSRLELFADIVLEWRDKIGEMAKMATCEQDKQLIGSLLALCDKWGVVAAHFGWDAVALFGIDPHVPTPDRQRRDRHGLFISLATGVHQSEIIEMTRDKAILKTQTGAEHTAQRFHHGRNNAVPIWEAAGDA